MKCPATRGARCKMVQFNLQDSFCTALGHAAYLIHACGVVCAITGFIGLGIAVFQLAFGAFLIPVMVRAIIQMIMLPIGMLHDHHTTRRSVIHRLWIEPALVYSVHDMCS
jgi:hypothetical protein